MVDHSVPEMLEMTEDCIGEKDCVVAFGCDLLVAVPLYKL